MAASSVKRVKARLHEIFDKLFQTATQRVGEKEYTTQGRSPPVTGVEVPHRDAEVETPGGFRPFIPSRIPLAASSRRYR